MTEIRAPNLPSRYEDLDAAFRGRLRAVPELNAVVDRAYRRMQVTGGIRFLPVFGVSGSGKTSAALELGTHLHQCDVFKLRREEVESREALEEALRARLRTSRPPEMVVAVVDQHEEAVGREELPRRFVETLSLLDRSESYRHPTLVIWLTTDREFQRELAEATTRNSRILLSPDFELRGPPKAEWPAIIEETFEFHNRELSLADYGVLSTDVQETVARLPSLGASIEAIVDDLSQDVAALHDLSRYRVVMLWPVTSGLAITRVQGFTNPREGYRLNWNAWYRELNEDDRTTLPLDALNRARLYFDMRLVPIAAADLEPLCRNLDQVAYTFHKSYLDRFAQSHFYLIATNRWNPANYSPLRERESQRADAARAWYPTVTSQPTAIGRRIAGALTALGVNAEHEQDIRTAHSRVRADVLVSEPGAAHEVIVELKAFAPDQTRPSAIKDAIRTTLRRHAQLAGFLQRQ